MTTMMDSEADYVVRQLGNSMNKIGAWWLACIEAKEGEEIKCSFLANRSQSSQRAVGGKLFLTNKRCLFTLHLFDYFTGGKKYEISLSQIVDVGIEPAGGDTFSGGLRNRLKIVHAGGFELFVVNNIVAVIESNKSVVDKYA